ncbi:hypothetical protein FACS1894152_3010 [Bacilli bacterium]|nr:hypothetical protein FACS1894152_3010 [Bacilli bacterium]
MFKLFVILNFVGCVVLLGNNSFASKIDFKHNPRALDKVDKVYNNEDIEKMKKNTRARSGNISPVHI